MLDGLWGRGPPRGSFLGRRFFGGGVVSRVGLGAGGSSSTWSSQYTRRVYWDDRRSSLKDGFSGRISSRRLGEEDKNFSSTEVHILKTAPTSSKGVQLPGGNLCQLRREGRVEQRLLSPLALYVSDHHSAADYQWRGGRIRAVDAATDRDDGASDRDDGATDDYTGPDHRGSGQYPGLPL